jgi:hypothetical protein
VRSAYSFFKKTSAAFRKSAPFPPTVCQASSAQVPVGSRLASFSAGVSHISSIHLGLLEKNLKTYFGVRSAYSFFQKAFQFDFFNPFHRDAIPISYCLKTAANDY